MFLGHPNHVYTFCLLWTERLTRDDSSSVQHLCWGHTGGWASPSNPFGALKASWVFLPPARMDAGCLLCHLPGRELFQDAVSRGAVWAMPFYSDGGEEENPGWSMAQNTGLKIMGSGC